MNLRRLELIGILSLFSLCLVLLIIPFQEEDVYGAFGVRIDYPSDILSLSPDNTLYNFTDNENNNAYEDLKSTSTLLNPPVVPNETTAATSSDYTNISASDNNRWLSSSPGEYEFQYYKFKIFEDADSIDNFKVHWEGYGSTDTVYFYIWNANSSSWDLLQSHASGSSDYILENTLTSNISHYIYENTVTNENQIWLVVRSYSAASCPILYSWNGERYEYIYPISYDGGLGFPGKVDEEFGLNDLLEPSQPLGSMVIQNSQLKAENGLFYLVIAEDMDEITYLDSTSLETVYHPKGTKLYTSIPIYVTDFSPVFPYFHSVLDPISPIEVIDENGRDILLEVSEDDNIWTEFGKAGEYSQITLNFGDLSRAKQIKLLLQADIVFDYSPPLRPSYVEVWDGENWKRVQERPDSLPELGEDAGAGSACVIDITSWFSKTVSEYKLRFNDWHSKSYNFILIDVSEDSYFIESNELISAEIYHKGKSIPTPNGEWDYYNTGYYTTTFEGHFTRYGDVTELIEKTDDKFVISLPGDAVKMGFEPNCSFLDLLVEFGFLERSYVLISEAYFKPDAMKKLVYGENYLQVQPLPFYRMSYYPYPENEYFPWDNEHLEWWNEHQTREMTFRKENHTIYTDYVKVVVSSTPFVTTESASDIGEENAILNATICFGAEDNVDIRFKFKGDSQCFNEGENENWSLSAWYYTVPTDPATRGNWGSRTPVNYVAAYDSSQADKDMANWVCDYSIDQVEIQKAIDNLSENHNGGKVVLCDGHYSFGNYKFWMKDNITFVGESQNNAVIDIKGSFSRFDQDSGHPLEKDNYRAQYLLFENFTIRSRTDISGERNGFHFYNGRDVVFRNIKVENIGVVAVYFEATTGVAYGIDNVWISNISMNTVGHAGILVVGTTDNPADNIYIDNNTLSGVGLGVPGGWTGGAGIGLTRCQNSKAVNNVVENCGETAFHFKPIVGSSDNILVQGNRFSNCSLKNVTENWCSIQIKGTELGDNLIIRGNDIEQLKVIHTRDNFSNILVDNNNLFNTAVIIDGPTDNVTLTNNVDSNYWDNNFTTWRTTTLTTENETIENLVSANGYMFRAEIRWNTTENYGDWENFTTTGLGTPQLSSPENNSTIYDNTPTLEWVKVGSYSLLIIDNDSDFGSAEINTKLYQITFTIDGISALAEDNYWWKVTGYYGNLESTSGVWTFEYIPNAIPIVEAVNIQDMDNIPDTTLTVYQYYQFKVEVRDGDTLSDVDEVRIGLWENNPALNWDSADSTRNHYRFKWVRQGADNWFEVGPDNTSPYDHLAIVSCIKFNDALNVDNIVFVIRLSKVATPLNSWNVFISAIDNVDSQDNEEFANKFSVNNYWEISWSDENLSFWGYAGETDVAAEENPIVATITTNRNFHYKVSIESGGFGVGESLYCDNNASAPYTVTLDNTSQILYHSQSWGEGIALNEYYYVDIPSDATTGEYFCNFYSEYEFI